MTLYEEYQQELDKLLEPFKTVNDKLERLTSLEYQAKVKLNEANKESDESGSLESYEAITFAQNTLKSIQDQRISAQEKQVSLQQKNNNSLENQFRSIRRRAINQYRAENTMKEYQQIQNLVLELKKSCQEYSKKVKEKNDEIIADIKRQIRSSGGPDTLLLFSSLDKNEIFDWRFFEDFEAVEKIIEKNEVQ